MTHRLVLASLVVLVMLSMSCKSTTEVAQQTRSSDSSSFELIQSHVFDVSCVQCHSHDEALINGNLDLTRGSSYAALINVMPDNQVARASGMRRVVPRDTTLSFLIRKLGGELTIGEGAPMPKDQHALSSGKIIFVKQWIEAGAPDTGGVANTLLLSDSSSDVQAPLVPLPIPAADSGFQIHMLPFDIPAGSEREIFRYMDNPNKTTQYVTSMDIRMREGSHHFILWSVDGTSQNLKDGDLRDRSDQEMNRPRDFVNGAQTPALHYDFPPGVALALQPGMGFDLNSHYVNTTGETIHGEAYINLYTTSAAKVQHYATPFLAADEGFTIPAHSTYTRKYTWSALRSGSTKHLFLLSSHAHKHMTEYKIFRNGASGELLYDNTDWHEPLVKSMDIVLNPDETLYSETTWKNDGDTPLRFGFTSEDEMSVIFGYYW